MNESENIQSEASPERSTPSGVADLRDQVDSLRKLLLSVLLVLLIISGTMNLYLLRQVMTVSKEKTAMQLLVSNYQTNDEPVLKNLIAGLQNYTRTHPEFMPVLQKYGIAATPAANALPATDTKK